MHPTWWGKVISDELFKFKPGLNILWGENGSGKSTLLKALSALTHCEQGGVPKVTGESLRVWKSFRSSCELDWDGHPCFQTSSDGTPGLIGGAGFDPDFQTAGLQQVMQVGKTSQGQQRLYHFHRILQHTASCDQTDATYLERGLKSDEDLKNESSSREFLIEELEKRMTLFRGLLEKLKVRGPGPKTLILDEPTANMDLEARADFWDVMARQTRFQVIVATHDVLALDLKDAHYIELGSKSRNRLGAAFYAFLTRHSQKFTKLPRIRTTSPKWKTSALRTASYLSRKDTKS